MESAENLPSVAVYTVSRLPERTSYLGPVAEDPVFADNHDDAIQKLRGSYLLVEFGQDFEPGDILEMKAPDGAVVLTRTLGELIR